MSFSVSFFARDVHSARSKLHEARAPEGVKALIELALASIPPQNQTSAGAGSVGVSQARTSDSAKEISNAGQPKVPRLCGILVETHGHIDESGGRSNIGAFRVEPFYD